MAAALGILGVMSCSLFATAASQPEPVQPSPTTAPMTATPHPEQIAFLSSKDHSEEVETHNDLYLMNADGSGLTRLTADAGNITSFAWSPDGKRIVFSSNGDGDYELYIMNVDGSGMTQLTKNSHIWDTDAAWSPDGQYLAYSAQDIKAFGETISLHIIRSDGTGDRLLADSGGTPSWSPDGSKIAFSVFQEGIYVIQADGQNKTRLVDSQGTEDDSYPRWSPDGKRILYAVDPLTEMGGLSQDIHPYIMNADGSEARMLVGEEYCVPPFTWSPDGQSIAYARGFQGPKMYVMNADGSNIRPLAENLEGEQPAWRP